MKHIFIFSLLLVLSSCDVFFHAAQVGRSNDPLFPTGPPPVRDFPTKNPTVTQSPRPPQTNSSWGVIGCRDQRYAKEFQKRLKAFLSTSYDSSNLASVGCTAEDLRAQKGGIFFKGAVHFENNGMLEIKPSSSQHLIVSDTSSIEIQIVTSNTSLRVTPIRFPLAPSGGSVFGNIASLIFEDSKGTIELTGEIKANGLFEGIATFENYVHWSNDESQLTKGELGIFKIQACSFFKC